MSFDPSWNLKWFDAEKNAKPSFSFTAINHGAFLSKSPNGEVSGSTVFEPRDFNVEFVSRLLKRLESLKEASTFELILPEYLKHRVQTLLNADLQSKVKVHYSSFLKLQSKTGYFDLRHRARIVNVDDSPVILKLLKHTFEEYGFFDILKQISDSQNAAKAILDLKPDIVTMDIQMPNKTGVDVVKEVLGREKMPILMISSLSMEDGSLVFDALNAGAFDYIQKPRLENKKEFVDELLDKSLLALKHEGAQSKPVPSKAAPKKQEAFDYPRNLLWAFGSSTGGVQALTRIMTSMPNSVPPTLVVQHIPPVYSKAFAESLDRLCPFTVKEAVHGEKVQKDHVYIAPGGFHMTVEEKTDGLFIVIKDLPAVNRFKPSVDFLFKDLAKLKGTKMVAAILTGMGKDGADGMLALKQQGAHTIAQDESSSTVYGMPRAAVELGAADSVVPLDSIAEQFLKMSTTIKKAA